MYVSVSDCTDGQGTTICEIAKYFCLLFVEIARDVFI